MIHIQKEHKGEEWKVLGVGCKLCETNQWHNICNFGSNLKMRPVQEDQEDEMIERKLLTCDECPFQTRQKLSIKCHKENIHQKIKRYSCSACTFQAYNRQHVKEHQTHNHEGMMCTIKGIGCHHCEKGDVHPKCVLPKHDRPEYDESDAIFSCKECPFKTHKKDILVPHQESVHQGIIRFFCGLCEMKSYYRQSVVIHHTRFHKNLKRSILRVGCEFCEKKEDHDNCTSGQLHPLKVKKRGKRPDQKDQENHIKRATCRLCNEKLQSRGELKSHYETSHKGQQIFKCDLCDYGSNWNANIKTHKESKHLNITHTCDVCGYKSNWNTQFLEHRREKHAIFQKKSKFNNEKMRGSLCDKCGFSTDDWKLLLFHNKQHHAYSCDICDYSSKTAHNLKVHKSAKHDRELPN